MPAEPRKLPPNRWVLLRWDIVMFVIAAIGFLVNIFWPYEISSTMLVVFGAAMAWVAYQMWIKLQAYNKALRE